MSKLFRYLVSQYQGWKTRRQRRRDNAVIAAQAFEIEQLRSALSLREREVKQLIEINARDRERVAWETAHFSRQIEEARSGHR